MQVVLSAIGDFSVNFRHLLASLGAIGRAELFLAQSALRPGQPGGVFRSMAGIADPFTLVSDKQVFQTQVNAGYVGCHWQFAGLEFAQAAHKVAARRILGNGYGAGLTGQLTAPANVQRGFALGQIQLAVPVLKGRAGELRRLEVPLTLECRVLGAAIKEVFEGSLLMAKALLQGHARHIRQKRQLRFFLEFGQSGVSADITDFFLTLIKGIGTPAQNRVIDKTHTAKGLSQQLNLFVGRVKPIFIGALHHASHFRIISVKIATDLKWRSGSRGG